MSKTYLIEQINPLHAKYLRDRRNAGKHMFAFRGGRRSGKTFFIMQFLITELFNEGRMINVASMTAEQGRLGAYADACHIIQDCPTLSAYLDCLQSPREIRNIGRGGKMVFNSYTNSETAKGIACDWLFVNEANNFTKQQIIDMMANVRVGVIFDFNPNVEFWIDDYFEDGEICDSTWKDNPFLTETQLEYFAQLKKDAERPNASPLDIRNYNIYYLGKYSELRGNIFIADELTFIKREELPDDITKVRVFADPSALVGSDSFACVLSGQSKTTGKVYVLDVFSINMGSKEQVACKLREWCGLWDRVKVYIETNGIIGQEFFRYAKNSGLPCESWWSHANKFERICAAYDNIRGKMVFVESPQLTDYMAQVYDFSNKCEHDDNADALASTISLQSYI